MRRVAPIFFILLGAQAVIAAPHNLTDTVPGVATSPSLSVVGTHRWITWLDYVVSGRANPPVQI